MEILTINMYKFIRYDILIQCHGNYILSNRDERLLFKGVALMAKTMDHTPFPRLAPKLRLIYD